MKSLTQPIRKQLLVLCVLGLICLGVGAPTAVAAQDKVSFDVVELQSLRRAYSLLDRKDFGGAASAYRDLANAAETSPKVRVAALEGEAFAMVSDLRDRMDSAAGDSRTLRLLKLDRRALLSHLDRVKPQADTVLMGYIRAVAEEEDALTADSFEGHVFEATFRSIQDQGAVLTPRSPVVAVVPKSAAPIVVQPRAEPSRSAGLYVSKGTSNVREGPGLSFAVLDKLQGGDQVRVATDLVGPDNSKWYQLSDNRGYVHATRLSPVGSQRSQAPAPATLPQTTDDTATAPKREKPKTQSASAAPAARGPAACSGPVVGRYRVIRLAKVYYQPGGQFAATVNVGYLVNNVTGTSAGHLVYRKSEGGGKFSCRFLFLGTDPSQKVVIKLR